MSQPKITDPRHQHFAKKLRIYARTIPTPTNRQARGLAKVDGRTRPGRIARAFRNDLLEYCGGPDKVNVVEREIIERCVFLQLKLSLMDAKIAAGDDTSYDSHCYLAWSASLQRALMKLGYRENVEIMRKRAETQLAKAYAR